MTRRVVITGMGLVSALGNDLDSAFNRLHVYKNAVCELESLGAIRGLNSHLAAPAQFTPPEHFTRKVLRTMGPVSVIAVYSAENALRDAGLLGSPDITNGRTGVAYGSSFGSAGPVADFFSMVKTNEIGNITSSSYIKIMPQTTAVNISLYFKTTGRLIPSGTACTSGSLSVGFAYENIKSGAQDIMIAGGAEELDPTQIAVFDTLYATSTKNDTPDKTPSPFDINRDGLVIGCGAGTLILEEYEHAIARGAKIYAEIVGFGTNTDGTHITQPNPETIAQCLDLSLKSANLSSKDIGYICLHGTGTKFGDMAESVATNRIFGDKTPASSLKSYVGHTLGACGALESIWSIQMMNNNWFAPTLNLNTVDDKCGALDYIMNTARNFSTDFVMNNNFAFGGINTSLIFKKTIDN
ncbi:MAG: beta-ketoacyl-ACP synthase [Alphaproteobacteria bacterium]|nr:beta-ketoacyl-ACP synthase [Alphaproteobacteria bacterium]